MRSFCSVLSAAALLGAAYGVDGAEQKGSASELYHYLSKNILHFNNNLKDFGDI